MTDNPLIDAWNKDQRRRTGTGSNNGNPLLDEWDRARGSNAPEESDGILDTVMEKVGVVGDFLAESMGMNFASDRWQEERARTGRGALDAATDEGVLDRASSLLERGGASANAGMATTIGTLTGSQRLKQSARTLRGQADMDVAGSTSWEDLKANPGIGTLGSFALDTTVESLPLMAAAAAPYVGLPAVAASQTGNIAQQRADANGTGEVSGRDLAIAAPFGIGSAALERTGVLGILEAPGRNAATRIARAAGKESLTEGVQSSLEYTGGSAGTNQGFDLVTMFDRAAGGAVGGAGMGGGIRGGIEIGAGGARAAQSRVTGRPIPKGVREQAQDGAIPLTAEDETSPLPTDLIAQGKSVLADADALSGANRVLGGAGLPGVGERVTVRYPDGRTETGTMTDAFTDADFDGAPGVKINLDSGGTLDEHVATLADAGVSVTPLSIEEMAATADAIDADLAAGADTPGAVTDGPTVLPEAGGVALAPAPPTTRGGFKVADQGKIAPVDNAKAIASELFPGARVTSWKRAAGAAGKAGSRSWHARSGAAIDMAPVEGMSFDQAVQRYRDAGYSIIEAIDETDPATMKRTGATGPHWHFVLGTGGTPVEGVPARGAQSGDPAADTFADDGTEPEGFAAAAVAPVDLPAAEPGGDLRGEPIDKEWVRFADTSGSLGVPRAQMPQIAAENRGAMVNFLNARGVSHNDETVPASSLKPTQAEFSIDKVANAKDFAGGDRAILVSSDDHVIDGHHQWLAKRDGGEDVRVIRLGATAEELLDIVPEFPSATQDAGETSPRPELGPTFDYPRDDAARSAVLRATLEGRGKALPPGAKRWLKASGFGAERGAKGNMILAIAGERELQRLDVASGRAADDRARGDVSWTIAETKNGKSIAITGMVERHLAAVTKAVPKAKPLNRADGAIVYPKQHEAAIREALDGIDREERQTEQPGPADIADEFERATDEAAPVPVSEATMERLRADADLQLEVRSELALRSEVQNAAAADAGAPTEEDAPAAPEPVAPQRQAATTGQANFDTVWKSKEFKAAMKPLGTMPHRESPVAADLVQGWNDGKARDATALQERYLRDIGAHIAAFQPNGFNPGQSYFEGFYAAVTGQAVEVRAVDPGNGKAIGAAQAWSRLDALIDPEPETSESPAPAPAKPKKQRAPKPSKPMDAFKFLARAGGINDTEGHDLSDRFGLDAATSRVAAGDRGKKKWRQRREMGTRRQSVFVPGAGPLIRESDMSIDRAGELLHEAGYLRGDDGGRPTIADTIAYLERGMEGNETLSKMLPLEQLSAADAYALPDNFEDMRSQMLEWANYQDADLTSDDVDALARLMLRDDIENEADALAALVNEAVVDALDDMRYENGDYDDALARYLDNVEPDSRDEGSAADPGDPPEGGSGNATGDDASDDQPEQEPRLTEPAGPTGDGGDIFGGATRDEARAALERRAEGRKSNDVDQRPPGSDGGLFDTSARDQTSLFSIPADNERNAVATLTGEELGVTYTGPDDMPALRTAALGYYKRELMGTSVTMADGVPATFTGRGLRKSTSLKGDILLRLIPAIPAILEKGEITYTGPGDRPDIAKRIEVAARVQLGDRSFNLFVIVREHSDTRRRQYDLTFDNGFRDLSEGAEGRSSLTDGDVTRRNSDPETKSPSAELNLRLVEEKSNAEVGASVEAARADLQQRLADYGLADRVVLTVGNAILPERVAGEFVADPDVGRFITIALDTSPDARFTLDHEAVHAARNMGLFMPAEWRSLEAAARGDKAIMGSVRKRYPSLTEEQQVEEAIADRFARWQRGDKERGFVAKAFERLRDTLRAVGEALRGNGFRTADSVMRALAGGEIGAREAGAAMSPADQKRLVRKIDTAAFRKWFGESKVVDDNGDPLIMYHGTSRAGIDGGAFDMFDTYASNYGLMGMGGYFTADPDVASSYTAKGRGDSPTVYPVFLSIKNPLDMDAVADPDAWESGFEGVSDYHEGGDTNESWYRAAEDLTRDEGFSKWEGAEVMQNGLVGMGHDGITHIGGGRVDPDSVRHRVFVAFDPEQIKSATGNSGDYDRNNPDIRYSVVDDGAAATRAATARTALARLAGSGSPFAGKMGDAFDRWRTAVQDRYLPLLRTQQRVEMQLGRPLAEGENPYLGEELLTGRIGAKLENLAENMVEPLFDQMHRDGVTIEELESYLYARHAPERNARIAKINPEFASGGGSGMSDIEAMAIINRIEKAGKTDAIQRVAAMVDAVRDYALQERIDAGLMTADEAKAWRETYQNYIPLRGKADADTDGAADGIRINRSSGITVKGKESRAAFGRRSMADDILAYTLLQAEEAIVRAETNRVARRFVELARAAPDAKFWQIDKVTRKPVINPTTGIVRYEDQSRVQPEDAPFTVTAKFDGEEHRVTMNRDNASARRLADSMRNLTQQQLDWVTQHLGKVNRFLSAVNTSWNPEFVITNAFRDLQAASINLAGIDIDGIVKNTLRDYPAALAGSMRGAFRTGQGDWKRWYEEFTREGGRVYFNQVEDLAGLKGRIEKEFSRAAARQQGIGMNRLTAQRGFAAVRDFVEAANSGVENAVRLAAYKNAREAGASKEQAASIAKNLTVNFNRRGQMGPALNAAYLFFNASMQGTTRIFTAMKSPRVRKILAGVVVGGFLIEMLNAFMSGTDDDGEDYYDKISDFDKSRNIIVMVPGGAGEHIKIPMPYGYNVFANAGRSLAEVVRRGGDRWQESTGNFLSSVADAFNPVGGTDSILKLIAPTIIDPVVDLEQNKDYAGRPIMPEQNPFAPPEPDAQRYYGSVGPHWKAVTEWMTRLTGGNDVEPGAIDVSPETLEHLSGVVLGAAGAFVDRNVGLTTKLATGEEVNANDFPLVRKVYGEKPGWFDKSAFYDRMGQIETALEYAKGHIEREDWDRFDAFVGKNEQMLSLEGAVKSASKEMREIRKAKRENDFAREMGKVDDDTWAETNDAVKEAEKLVIGQFNTLWNVAMLPRDDTAVDAR